MFSIYKTDFSPRHFELPPWYGQRLSLELNLFSTLANLTLFLIEKKTKCIKFSCSTQPT